SELEKSIRSHKVPLDQPLVIRDLTFNQMPVLAYTADERYNTRWDSHVTEAVTRASLVCQKLGFAGAKTENGMNMDYHSVAVVAMAIDKNLKFTAQSERPIHDTQVHNQYCQQIVGYYRGRTAIYGDEYVCGQSVEPVTYKVATVKDLE